MDNEELQEAEVQEVETAESEVETVSSAEAETGDGAELATVEQEAAAEEAPEDKAQKVINAKHRQFKQEERKRLKLEAEIAELRQSNVKSEAAEVLPIPDLPDSWDEDFQQKLAEREKAIRANAESGFKKQLDLDRRTVVETQHKAKAEKVRNEQLLTYADRAKNFGIKETDLIEAANIVADAQVPQALADFLISAEDGPLLTAYLADAKSDIDLYDLQNVNSIDLGLRISEIRAKAANLKPKATSAPPPASAVRGKGAAISKHPALEGATFT
jgi:hypothetical protein